MIRIILVTGLLFFTQMLIGQSYTTLDNAPSKVKKKFEKGKELLNQGDQEKALELFQKTIEIEPQFIDAFIQIGGIHYEWEQLEEAEQYFEKAIAIDSTYMPRVLYTLGITEYRLDKYEEAAQHLEQYLESGIKRERQRKMVTQLLASCRFAAKAIKNPVPFDPQPLGPAVNTDMPEYLPSMTADGEILIFTRRNQGQEDILWSKKENGEWQTAQLLGLVNTPDNEGSPTISGDGKLLLFTACNRRYGMGSCDLYFTEGHNEIWRQPQNLGPSVNSKYWESQPSISANGDALYFVSNRPGGLGDKDIWVSYRQPNGSWGEPRNLGAPINTEEDEQSPFIHPDGKTLYFESDGHPGMGGHDLFVSRMGEDGQWSEPQNLGYPINSKANEGALFVTLDGKQAYFASDRKNWNPDSVSLFDRADAGMQTDIFGFELHPAVRPQGVTYVKATVYDKKTKAPLEADVEFAGLPDMKIHASALTGTDGSFLVCLPTGKDYALNVSKKGYLFHSENFALSDTVFSQEPYILEIFLEKIPEETGAVSTEEPIVLRNIFFETGSAELKPESRLELDRLKKLLEDYPYLNIQIRGHTDHVGTDEDNQVLSENRAKAVYEYLIEKGIEEVRLSYIGFGESQPIDTNETVEGRRRNRRTEFLIRD